MARAALFDHLRRLYRISQAAIMQGIPADEAADWSEAQLSRRQILQRGMAGSAALATLPWATRHWEAFKPLVPPGGLSRAADDRVLIVGAGIAGLTAAYRLRQADVAVDVVEATGTVGGRMRSLSNASGILSAIELGGEFIDSGHRHIHALAAELGLSVVDLYSADAGLKAQTWYFQGQVLNPEHLIPMLEPLIYAIQSDLRGLASGLTYRTSTPAAAQLDQMSLADYLDRLAIAPVLRSIVRVAYLNEFGREPEEQSCLNLLLLMGSDPTLWQLYGDSDERYHIAGGNDQIPRLLAAQVATAIDTGTILEAIDGPLNGPYRVSLRQGASSIERTYSRIVLALPFTLLRQVAIGIDLPPVKRQAIQLLGYGSHSKLMTPYRERIWRTRYGASATLFSDLDFQGVWESTRYEAGPGGWLANLAGGKQGLAVGRNSPDLHAQQIATQLEPLFPGLIGLRQGRAVRAFWPGEPYQQGSYSCYLTGQWTQFGGAEGERVGNLWFAGEHCSRQAQGYMDGACETGDTAAREILQEMGVSALLA